MSHFRRYFHGALITIAVVTTLSACATLTRVPSEPLITPTYSWSTSTAQKPDSAGVVLALIGPVYAPGIPVEMYSAITTYFHGLRSAIETSFQQLLLNKGFGVSGPFSSVDNMTYQDKKLDEIAVYASLAPSLTLTQPHLYETGDVLGALAGQPTYNLAGDVLLGGTFTLIAVEPFTGQKLLVKTFTIPTKTIAVKGRKTYQVSGDTFFSTDSMIYDSKSLPTLLPLLKDPGIERPIATAFESYFTAILNTIDTHISVMEMKQLDVQAKQIRKQARFVAN